jgi:DNA-binding beta-propeller fold protein YncE
VSDTRGIALSSDQKRIYVVGRSPDTLLVISVDGSDNPTFRLRRTIPLPLGADQIAVIARNDGADLVAITCSADGDLVLYDERVGRLVVDIPGASVQPYAIAVDARTLSDGRQAARLFLSSFGDGRVIVVDVPDLNLPQQARVIARLGTPQTCLIQPKDASCQ